MSYYTVQGPTGAAVERLDRSGLWSGEPLQLVRPPTAAEVAGMDAADDAAALIGEVEAARAALTAALGQLAAPLDDAGRAQVDAALIQYRALPPTPPADVVDLANRVSTHIQSNAYLKAVEARNAHMVAEMTFVSDPTVSHAQLVAHVRELTRRIWDLRGGA